MTESATADPRSPRRRAITLSLLAVPAGALLAWLALLGTLYVPTDSALVWLGVPLLVVAAPSVWAATRRSVASRVALVVAGVLALAGVITLVFFAWLFWQMGSGLGANELTDKGGRTHEEVPFFMPPPMSYGSRHHLR